MKSGGYQIIDLQNKPLTSGVGMVYDGVYEKIEGTRKAILLSGLNVDGVEHRDCFPYVYMSGSSYMVCVALDSEPTSYTYIRIDDTDVVTITDK